MIQARISSSLGLPVLGFATIVLGAGCTKSQSAKAPVHGEHGTAEEHAPGGDHGALGRSGEYLAGMTAVVQTPVIPQCREQRNAPPQQLAPSYFEDMQPCVGRIPPQLQAAHSATHGSLDENGDCNLGKVGATEVVCHYHTSYEFTARAAAPQSAKDVVEVHCIAFELDAGKRKSTPIVFGKQLVCRPGTKPSALAAKGHGEGGHATTCGADIPSLFGHADSCDMRCCQNGTLTKPRPGLGVRPDFAICAEPQGDVDCEQVLANMHPHAPHRPHDRVGPSELYAAPAARGNPPAARLRMPKALPVKAEPSKAAAADGDLSW